MKKLKRIKLLSLALLAAAVLGTSSIAVAQNGGSGSGSGDGSGSGSGGGGRLAETSISSRTTSETETEHSSTEIEANHPELRKKGLEALTEMRKEHKENSQAERQKFCEAHKDGITNKFSRIVTNSERIQARISSIQDKAVAYKTDNNLTIDNWDALVAAADTAKANSAASIEALKAVKPTVDCNSTSVASDVATFKAAAATTRDSLKAYKSSVKDILKALEAAKEASEGSQT